MLDKIDGYLQFLEVNHPENQKKNMFSCELLGPKTFKSANKVLILSVSVISYSFKMS